ncbi:hypothetical protein GMJAKD_07480 [Candidatus Electrothrix aarhusensis]
MLRLSGQSVTIIGCHVALKFAGKIEHTQRISYFCGTYSSRLAMLRQGERLPKKRSGDTLPACFSHVADEGAMRSNLL